MHGLQVVHIIHKLTYSTVLMFFVGLLTIELDPFRPCIYMVTLLEKSPSKDSTVATAWVI